VWLILEQSEVQSRCSLFLLTVTKVPSFIYNFNRFLNIQAVPALNRYFFFRGKILWFLRDIYKRNRFRMMIYFRLNARMGHFNLVWFLLFGQNLLLNYERGFPDCFIFLLLAILLVGRFRRFVK